MEPAFYLLLNPTLPSKTLDKLIEKYKVIYVENEAEEGVRYAIMLGEYRLGPPTKLPDISKWTDRTVMELEVFDTPVPIEEHRYCFPFNHNLEESLISILANAFQIIELELHGESLRGIAGGIYQEPEGDVPARVHEMEFVS